MPKKNDDTDAYKKTIITSAGKLKSVLLLIDRAVLLLKEAKAAPEKRPANIVKTQNILAQLECSLNTKEGNLAGDLFYLYDYLFAELENRDEKSMDVSINMLGQLRDVFTEVRKRPRP